MQINPPQRTEAFDVVLIKNGVAPHTAKSADFKRVRVTGTDTIDALTSEIVGAEKDYRPLFATPPGAITEPEAMARSRELEGPATDRSKI